MFNVDGIVVNIVQGDITKEDTECIVSSDDTHIGMGGGSSAAILGAAGESVWEETRKYVPAELWSANHTSAGNMSAKYIIHTIVIDYEKWTYPSVETVRKALINTLNKAEELQCESISLPAFGTRAGGLDNSSAAIAIVGTLLTELKNYKRLKKVNIVLCHMEALMDFFVFTVRDNVKKEYELRIKELEKEKKELIEKLNKDSKYKDFPFPIAYLKKFVDVQVVHHSRFTSHLDFFENIQKFMSLIVISSVYNCDSTSEDTKKEIQAFFEYVNTPGFGSWDEFLCDKILKQKKVFLESNAITKSIYEFYQEGKNRAAIKSAIKYRNEVKAHGFTKSEAEYKEIVDNKIEPMLKTFFNNLSFFNAFSLILIEDIDFEEDYDGVLYKYTKIVGESPLFPMQEFRSKTIKLFKKGLYMMNEDFNEFVKLSPFIVYEPCSACATVEPFYLLKIKPNKCIYSKPRGNHEFENEKYRKRFQ